MIVAVLIDALVIEAFVIDALVMIAMLILAVLMFAVPLVVVVGAGVIGIEYASMFAALGTKVTVVEKRSNMLEFCDAEIIEALKFHLRDLAVTFRFGEEVTAVEVVGA